jgi:hypothetical protein
VIYHTYLDLLMEFRIFISKKMSYLLSTLHLNLYLQV